MSSKNTAKVVMDTAGIRIEAPVVMISAPENTKLEDKEAIQIYSRKSGQSIVINKENSRLQISIGDVVVEIDSSLNVSVKEGEFIMQKNGVIEL